MWELQKTFEHIFATWARNMFEHVKHEKKKKIGGGKEGRREGEGLAVVWVLLLYKYVSSSKMFSEKLEKNFRPNLYYIKFLSIVLTRVDF